MVPPPYANGHISAIGDPIHFMFGSRVGFSGTRIERRYLLFEQIQDGVTIWQPIGHFLLVVL